MSFQMKSKHDLESDLGHFGRPVWSSQAPNCLSKSLPKAFPPNPVTCNLRLSSVPNHKLLVSPCCCAAMPALSHHENIYHSILTYATQLRQRYWNEVLELPSSNSSSSLSVSLTHSSSTTSSSSSSASSTSSSLTQQSSGHESDIWITHSSDQDEAIGDAYHHTLCRLHDYFVAVVNTCILFSNGPVPKVSQLHLVLEWYRKHHEAQFCRNLHVHPLTFDEILYRIEHDPIFYSDLNNNQTPISHQLAIMLFRFGHFGNAASVESVAQWAGCSVGLVVSCTHCVTIAIIQLKNQVVKVPNPAQKEEAKSWVESVSCPAW
jgi:hypothetical protein